MRYHLWVSQPAGQPAYVVTLTDDDSLFGWSQSIKDVSLWVSPLDLTSVHTRTEGLSSTVVNSQVSRRWSACLRHLWSPCYTARSSTSLWLHLVRAEEKWEQFILHMYTRGTVWMIPDLIEVYWYSFMLFHLCFGILVMMFGVPECPGILVVTLLLSRSRTWRCPDWPPDRTVFPSQQKHLSPGTW
jgi:hypothetical protein